MPGPLEYLEHDGGEDFTEEKKFTRKGVKNQKIKLLNDELLKIESLEQKQIKYLSPENPALWNDIDD